MASNSYAGVFPLTVRMREVEILIFEIIPAGIADFAVNHRNLAMVAIVHEHVEPWQRIKNATLDSDCFEFFGKRHVDEHNRSHIVIKNANLNACLDTFFQNRLDLLPGFLVLDCVYSMKMKSLASARSWSYESCPLIASSKYFTSVFS